MSPPPPKNRHMPSPTARTLQALREAGYLAEVVEKWIPMAKIRKDLFGIIDIVAIKKGQPGSLGIQATSGSNVSSRVKKALANPNLQTWLETGNRFQVWGYAKQGKRGERKRWAARCLEAQVKDGTLVFSDQVIQRHVLPPLEQEIPVI